MNERLIFFDIDGTIWDWAGNIPASTVAAIEELKAAGHHPVMCTGRARGALYHKKLEALGFDGIVAACGGHVEYEGKMIYGRYVEQTWVKKLIELGSECRIPLVLEGPEKHWVSQKGFEKDDFVDRMYEYMSDRIIPLKDYQPDMKINKFAGDILRCSDYARFREELSVYYSFIEHGIVQNLDSVPGQEPNAILGVMEATPYGVSKADGICRLCEYLGVDPKETYSVGDSANDIDMLKFTGVGIAMGNGSDSIKAVADYITTDINEDGIYNAMTHFGLI